MNWLTRTERRARKFEAAIAVARATLNNMASDRLGVWVGLSHGRGVLPRGIKVYTRGKYWHVKIRIGTGSPNDPVFEASFLGRMQAGLKRYWVSGVRLSYAKDHAPEGQDWYPVILDSHGAPFLCRQLFDVCAAKVGAGYDFWSGLRFVPVVRVVWGDREWRRQRATFNCSKFGLVVLREVGLEPIPRKVPFRCAPGDFVHSALLADPVVLDVPKPYPVP